MNTNLIHNLLNVGIAGMGAALLASGCVETAAGTLDCSASWISPKLSATLMGAMGAAKIAINVLRDGFFGLFKNQPPVQ